MSNKKLVKFVMLATLESLFTCLQRLPEPTKNFLCLDLVQFDFINKHVKVKTIKVIC
jgi:hypothetical protein